MHLRNPEEKSSLAQACLASCNHVQLRTQLAWQGRTESSCWSSPSILGLRGIGRPWGGDHREQQSTNEIMSLRAMTRAAARGSKHVSVAWHVGLVGACCSRCCLWRCCFFPRGRCTNGSAHVDSIGQSFARPCSSGAHVVAIGGRYNCEFCHYEHEKRKRKNKKKIKKKDNASQINPVVPTSKCKARANLACRTARQWLEPCSIPWI